MDAQKLGAFIAATRKELQLTQAQLAQRIRVTDKAVSRWERGLGLPDIQLLEPLAQALGVELIELMRAERSAAETLTKEEASSAVAETVQQVHRWRRSFWQKLLCTALILLLPVLIYFFGTGLMQRSDVFLGDYSAMAGGNAVTMQVGVAGSMGYVRGYRVVEESPERVVVRFYSAFGGLNSRLGAQNVFLLLVDDDCREICFARGHRDAQPVLQRDASGAWQRPE